MQDVFAGNVDEETFEGMTFVFPKRGDYEPCVFWGRSFVHRLCFLFEKFMNFKQSNLP